MTERDCAVLAASFRMARPGNADVNRKSDFDRKADPAVLSRNADQIQRDPQFQEWFKSQTPESLNKAVETGKFNSIGNFEKDLKKQQREAAKADQQRKAEYDQQMLDNKQHKRELEKKMADLKKDNPKGYKELSELKKSQSPDYHKRRTELLNELSQKQKANPAPQKQEPKAPVKVGGPELGG